MLAYNPYWLEAFSVTRSVERLARERLITADQLRIIRAAFTNPLYAPRLTERITLFLFTCIAIASVHFVILQLFPADTGKAEPTHLLATGLLCILTLELLIRTKKTYRAGVDDATLYAGLAFTVYGTTQLLISSSGDDALSTASLLAFPLFVAAAVRYVDRLVAIAAFACLLFLAHSILDRVVPTSFFQPLALMAVSGTLYAVLKNVRSHERLAPWLNCIEALKVAALLAFYFCANTFLAEHLLLTSSHDRVAFASFMQLSFVLTLALPVGYIMLGLIARDRTMLRVGLLVEAVSLATARYYNPAVALEHALIIVGVTLILLSLIAIQMLKSKTTGFTVEKVPLQIPEEVPLSAIALYDRFTAQREAVRAFEAGKSRFGGGASLGW